MIIQRKEDNKPQCWFEEEDGGYRICIRKLKSDYFRTEYILCDSKDTAINFVHRIKENVCTNIPSAEIKPYTSNCTEQDKDINIEKCGDANIEPVLELIKPKAKFEFECDEFVEQYRKIPRYEVIPEECIHITGVSKIIRYGSVQKLKGVL